MSDIEYSDEEFYDDDDDVMLDAGDDGACAIHPIYLRILIELF
jgi:hypothetical protein